MTSATLSPLPQRVLRKGDLPTLIGILKDQHAAKSDVVLRTDGLRSSGGKLVIADQEVSLGPDGVTDPNGVYSTASIVDQNLADLFGIPVRYLRRMRDEHVGLLDTNINEWAQRATGTSLVRMIQGIDPADPTSSGYVRSILSSKYGINDHLDTVMAVLSGLRDKGLDASNIKEINLSDERLYMYVDVPEIAIEAGDLVKNYHFYDRASKDFPLMNAGIYFTNSEVGRGAFEIGGRASVQVCTNGLRREVAGDRFRKVHLGGRLEEGNINWSNQTRDAAAVLVKNQVSDAVENFLSEGWLTKLRDDLIADANVEVNVATIAETLGVVAKKMAYSVDDQAEILKDFMLGGQPTSGGILNAVTSYAQRVEDPDKAFELEGGAVQAMQLVAAAS
jgi:hypothetical protein